MSDVMRSIVGFFRKPEWVAAIALLIQGAILLLQAVILRRHGATMEEHAGIAKAQAETAALIGKTLDQQEKILREQTKIMAEQFRFQRTAMAQADRQEVFSALLSIRKSLHMLIAKIQEPGERYEPRIAEEQRMQAELLAAILPVQNAFITSVHLTPEEKDYFGRYVVEVYDAVAGDMNFPSRLPKMKLVQQNNSEADFLKMVAKIGKPQEQ
jgi:hypothetical protein